MASSFPRPALAAALAFALMPAAGEAAPNRPPVEAASPAAAEDPAYGELFAAMLDSADQQAAYDGIAASIAREYAKVPEIAALEAAKPGLIAAIVTGLRPALVSYGDRVRAQYRPRMLAAFARHLSPAEARDIAELYRSPIGRKLMAAMSRNVTADSVVSGIGTAMAEGKDPNAVEVSRSQVEADMRRATASAMGELTPADFEALGQMARNKPALFKLNLVRGDIMQLRTAMENEPPTPDEEKRIEAAVIAAMTAHMGG
ncbi:DUF2059 domain-containing protein [Erythrobacter sp. NE805]|uniref:DUF2059 domain-containing protein n=1 Tax=Erythrobacter sp. NE805 TaxID=3389875 RepID=UPI00396B4261